MNKEEFFHFYVIPVFIGILGGISAIVFRFVISFFTNIADSLNIGDWDYFYIFTTPLIFYGAYYLIEHYLFLDSSNVTLDNIAKKIALMSGKFDYIKGYTVLFLSSLSIGFGVPIGREGPIAKLGGLVTEMILDITKVNRINLSIYLGAGISSAVAATFNAPIAGTILGIEILIGKVNTYIVIPLIVSCVTSTFVARSYIGDFTAFYVPHLIYDNRLLPFVPLEGIFLSIVGIVLVLSIRFLSKIRLKLHKYWNKIVIVFGLIVGFLIAFVPETRGVGYIYVSQIFDSFFSLKEIVIIMFAKLGGVILSIGSGIFGGILSPSIFIGAFGGYGFGKLVAFWTHTDPRVTALIGSAAMLAAVSRAPLRSSIIITELTHSYQLLLPILIISAISAYILSKFEPGSYFKRSLLQRGIDPESTYLQSYLEKLDIEPFIQKIKPLSPNILVSQASLRFRNTRVGYIPVVENGKLVGIVSLRDLRKRFFLRQRGISIKSIMTPHPFAIRKNCEKRDIFKAIAMLNANIVPYVDEHKNYLGMVNIQKIIRDLTLRKSSNKKSYKKVNNKLE